MDDYAELRRWQLSLEVRQQLRDALRRAIDERYREATGLLRLETAEVGKKAAALRWGNANPGDHQEKWLLEVFDDLYRAGLIHYGDRFDRCGRDYFWMTSAGIEWLEDWQVSPENRSGYLADVDSLPNISPIARSYLEEAQTLFLAGHHRSAAVMVGAVSEVTILEIREALVARLTQLTGKAPTGNLANDRASTKRAFEAVKDALSARQAQMSHALAASVDSHWPAFLHEIRRTRNDAGHPKSIAPVQRDDVKAALNQVRAILRVASEIKVWIGEGLTS